MHNVGNIFNRENPFDKTAIIDLSQDHPRLFSYAKLDNWSNAVARSISKRISKGDRVVILGENSVEYVAAFFGIMRAGGVAVLVNTKLSKEQINNIILESQPKLIFSDFRYDTDIDQINLKNEFAQFLDFGRFDTHVPVGDETAFILYTSGTYNNPKGALITHTGHIWTIKRNVNMDIEHGAKRINLISAPLYHANGLTTTEVSLASHGTVVLLPKFDSRKAIKAINDFKVNTLYCVPTMLAMMLQEQEELSKNTLTSLRQIRSASSHMGQKLIANLEKYFPNVNILNNYGITEVGPALFGSHPNKIPRPPGSVGHPVAGIDYRIVDGILEVKCPSMMKAYNSNQSANITNDGYFVTGDLFRVDENNFYYFEGRRDDMFKCGAYRIYPEEVAAMLESHPAVLSAFVIGIPDEIKGYKPYAFVVLDHGSKCSEEELKQYALSKGPAYQHPRRIWFIDNMPLAGTNKIDKRKLEELAKINLASS